MPTDDARTSERTDEVIDVTDDRRKAAAAWGKQAGREVADRVRQLASHELVREAPYAAVGLGDVVVEAARETDATSLPERVRRTPVAVAERVRDLGDDVRTSYLELAARGRTVRHKVESDPTTAEARRAAERHASTATSQAKGAATSARRGVEETAAKVGDVAATARRKSAATATQAKGAATSAGAAASERAEAASSSAAKVGTDGDTGTGNLEDRTVAQLRTRASQLGIEGRSGMKKQELIDAIRAAT
jgi:hypothetical protein